jgi:hypothetical protein
MLGLGFYLTYLAYFIVLPLPAVARKGRVVGEYIKYYFLSYIKYFLLGLGFRVKAAWWVGLRFGV